jgi:transposase
LISVPVSQSNSWLAERTSDYTLPQGINQVTKQLPLILEDAENGLTPLSRKLFAEQYEQLKAHDDDFKAQYPRINRLCQKNALNLRFLEVLGISPIIATIMVSDISDGKGYTKSRNYAVNIGYHANTAVATNRCCWALASLATSI